MYDNKLIFTKDKMIFDPGEDGQIYVNWACDLNEEGYDADFLMDWERTEVSYDFSWDDGTLTLPAHATVGYIPNNECYENPTFWITRLDREYLILVCGSETANTGNSAIYWQMVFKKVAAAEASDYDIYFHPDKAYVYITKR